MTLQGHVKDILALSWSPNGYQLASGSADNTVRIWDMRNLRSIYTIAAHRSLVSDVKFYRGQPPVSGAMDTDLASHAGQYLVTGGYDGSVKMWSADDFKLIKSLEGHEGKVMGVDVSNGTWSNLIAEKSTIPMIADTFVLLFTRWEIRCLFRLRSNVQILG
jgi:U4/U6 small nuclear ribonucleoprotein PRP4